MISALPPYAAHRKAGEINRSCSLSCVGLDALIDQQAARLGEPPFHFLLAAAKTGLGTDGRAG